MRKLSAIILLFVFISSTEVVQLLKLPYLITHFIDHRLEEDQSLAEYFHEHYIHHHRSNTDEQEDNQLPFKSTNIQLMSFTYLVPMNHTMLPQVVVATHTGLPSNAAFVPFDQLKDIFHPPRTV